MHAHAPTNTRLAVERCGLDRDGVVEIAGVGGVDGEHEAPAQVAVARSKGAFGVDPCLCRLCERRFGKRGFQLVARYDEVDCHALVVLVAEHLDHVARRRRVAVRKRGDGHAHDGAIGNMRVIGEHRENVVLDKRVCGHDHPERLSAVEITYDLVMGALEHAHDAGHAPMRVRARCLPPRIRAFYRCDFHHVIGKRAVHVLLGNEILALSGLHEPVPAAVHLHASTRIAACRSPGMCPPACHECSMVPQNKATPGAICGQFPNGYATKRGARMRAPGSAA